MVMSNETRPATRRGWRSRRRWIFLGVTILLLGGGITFSVHTYLGNLERARFMTLVAGIRTAGGPVDASGLAMPTFPPEQDGMPDLREAARLSSDLRETWDKIREAGIDPPLDPEQRTQLT